MMLAKLLLARALLALAMALLPLSKRVPALKHAVGFLAMRGATTLRRAWPG